MKTYIIQTVSNEYYCGKTEKKIKSFGVKKFFDTVYNFEWG